MKIRWEFQFEYERVRFGKPLKYEVVITKEETEAFDLPAQAFKATVMIEPKDEDSVSIIQRGKMSVFLPGRQETKDLAYSIASSLAHQITFSQERVSIDWSFVVNELLPETTEEIEELGEKRFGCTVSFFGCTVSFTEVPDNVPFVSSSIQKVISNPLIIQFNIADNAQNPIDKFIGLFKILEDLYGLTPLKPVFIKSTKKKRNNKKQDLKPSLKSSDELIQIASENIEMKENRVIRPISQTEIEGLFDKLVDTRHECAHLRSSKGFGITYGDSRVQTEVEPLLEPLRTLAYVYGRLVGAGLSIKQPFH